MFCGVSDMRQENEKAVAWFHEISCNKRLRLIFWRLVWLCDSMGLVLHVMPFKSAYGLVYGADIGLCNKLSGRAAVCVLAHEIGHCILRHGNILGADPVTRDKAERQAWAMAGKLLRGAGYTQRVVVP